MAISVLPTQHKMAPPSVTSTALLSAPPHDKAMLLDVQELLHKIFVRNRNQHRRSYWWKALHAFRKQIDLLLEEMDIHKKAEREAKVEARLQHWDQNCIHKWYCQFTQLLAVSPFAMLGLVMMASVARVCRITGITAVYEEIASSDVKGVLRASDELMLAEGFSRVLDAGEKWDEGVVVEREVNE